MKKYLILPLILSFFFVFASVSFAQSTTIKSNTSFVDIFMTNPVSFVTNIANAQEDGTGIVSNECGYNLEKGGRMCNFVDFMGLIQRLIGYIFVLVLPIAAIVFAYAGFLFITSGGDPGKKTAAKNAMTKLLIGIVVIMMAWLLVKTVLTSLGVDAKFTQFL